MLKIFYFPALLQLKSVKKTFHTFSLLLLSNHNKIDITMSIWTTCLKKLSDLVNTSLNKCFISLGDKTEQPTWKKKH